MSMRRNVLPIVALVAILAVLVGVRLFADGDTDSSDEAAVESAAETTANPSTTAAEGIRFTDVTAEAGLDEPHADSELTGESAMTAGAAVADVDDDGDLDLYLTRVGLPNRLLENDGSGAFTDITDRAGVAGVDPDGGSSAAAFADVDADGDVDLVVSGAGRSGLTLYRNDGSGTFRDATADSGLDTLPEAPEGALDQLHGLTFHDYDRDGRLDLLVTHWDTTSQTALADAEDVEADEDGRIVCARAAWLAERGWPRPDGSPPNRGALLRNEGDGRFRDVTDELGLRFDEVLGFTGSFADLDDDGWDDLLLTGDFCTSRVFRNEGGERFVDVTAASGAGTDENAMGSVVRDVDGDGDPDWFVTSIGPVGDAAEPFEVGGFGSSGNRMYLNEGDGTFSDATDDLGLRNGGWGWGAAIEDLGNDGRLSVVMTNGYSIGEPGSDQPAGTPADDPLVLWVPDGDGYVDVAEQVGLVDPGLGRALVPFDMDRDGDLDLLVANWGTSPSLFRNDSDPNAWLTVRLEDPLNPGNPEGIGARVVVDPGGGRDPVTRWVRSGGSYESQVPAEVHVGLGDLDSVERVEVTWPGAAEPQVLTDVEANQVLVVARLSAAQGDVPCGAGMSHLTNEGRSSGVRGREERAGGTEDRGVGPHDHRWRGADAHPGGDRGGVGVRRGPTDLDRRADRRRVVRTGARLGTAVAAEPDHPPASPLRRGDHRDRTRRLPAGVGHRRGGVRVRRRRLARARPLGRRGRAARVGAGAVAGHPLRRPVRPRSGRPRADTAARAALRSGRAARTLADRGQRPPALHRRALELVRRRALPRAAVGAVDAGPAPGRPAHRRARRLRACEHPPGTRPGRRPVGAAAGPPSADRPARRGGSDSLDGLDPSRFRPSRCRGMRGRAAPPRPLPSSALPLGLIPGHIRQRTACVGVVAAQVPRRDRRLQVHAQQSMLLTQGRDRAAQELGDPRARRVVAQPVLQHAPRVVGRRQRLQLVDQLRAGATGQHMVDLDRRNLPVAAPDQVGERDHALRRRHVDRGFDPEPDRPAIPGDQVPQLRGGDRDERRRFRRARRTGGAARRSPLPRRRCAPS